MIMATLPRQLLFLLLLVISVKISISADCYYMNREKTTELTRCSNDANPKIESTLCCMPGDRCMVNSLCLREKKDGDKHYYRGGCTIKDWKGKSLYDCPPILCKPARVAGMYPCNTSNPDTGFVCQEAFPDGPPDHCDSSVTFDGELSSPSIVSCCANPDICRWLRELPRHRQPTAIPEHVSQRFDVRFEVL